MLDPEIIFFSQELKNLEKIDKKQKGTFNKNLKKLKFNMGVTKEKIK